MSTSDFSPGHRAPPRIFANPKESQLAEFTQLLFQSGSKTAVDQYLSILFLETANLRRQLYELNKLRYRVMQAELSARNRAQAHSGARGRNPHQRLP